MAIVRGIIPFWTFFLENGELANNARIYSYSNQNFTIAQPIYQDPAGINEYPQGFEMAQGRLSPAYFDDTVPYFIQVWTQPGKPSPGVAGGQKIFEVQNYTPQEGGGGPVISNTDIRKYTRNGQFRLVETFPDSIGEGVLNNGRTLIAPPSWYFEKSNTSGTDTAEVIEFSLGQTDVPQFPHQFLRLSNSAIGAGETYKDLYYEIPDVETFEAAQFSFSLALRSSTSSSVDFIVEQNFGTGGAPSAAVETTFATFALNNSWAIYSVNTGIIPSVAGLTRGTNNDDTVRLKIRLPINAAYEVDITNVQFELGQIVTPYDFDTEDEVEDDVGRYDLGRFPTGFMTPYVGDDPPIGWVLLNDTSIGDEGSAATQRADPDTRNLFTLIWTRWDDLFAPVSGGRGASAEADFDAGKAIQLGTLAGRVPGIAGDGSGLSPRSEQTMVGAETHALSLAEMPAHNHPGSTGPIGQSSGGVARVVLESAIGFTGIQNNSFTVTIASQGSGSAHNNMQPTSFLTWIIKL